MDTKANVQLTTFMSYRLDLSQMARFTVVMDGKRGYIAKYSREGPVRAIVWFAFVNSFICHVWWPSFGALVLVVRLLTLPPRHSESLRSWCVRQMQCESHGTLSVNMHTIHFSAFLKAKYQLITC